VNVVPVASSNLGIVKKRFSSFIRKRFVGYSIVGAFVLGLGLATLTTLVEVGHVNQIIAGLCSTVVSVEVNFFLNWRINWRDRRTRLIRAWPAFHATRVFALTANQILYTVLVAGGVYYLAATGVTTTLSVVWNYYLNDKVAFRQQDEK
jgi:putative flippase GtrA